MRSGVRKRSAMNYSFHLISLIFILASSNCQSTNSSEGKNEEYVNYETEGSGDYDTYGSGDYDYDTNGSGEQSNQAGNGQNGTNQAGNGQNGTDKQTYNSTKIQRSAFSQVMMQSLHCKHLFTISVISPKPSQRA